MGSSATRIVCPSTLPVQTKGKWEGDGGGGDGGWLWSCWPFNLFVCSSCITSEGFETARVCVFCRWVASGQHQQHQETIRPQSESPPLRTQAVYFAVPLYAVRESMRGKGRLDLLGFGWFSVSSPSLHQSLMCVLSVSESMCSTTEGRVKNKKKKKLGRRALSQSVWRLFLLLLLWL